MQFCVLGAVVIEECNKPCKNALCVTQGASEAEEAAAALIPLRRDTPEEQEAQLAVLAFLTEEQLAGLLTRQPPTQELSLLQWTRAAGVEPPPPPDNVTEALEGAPIPDLRECTK